MIATDVYTKANKQLDGPDWREISLCLRGNPWACLREGARVHDHVGSAVSKLAGPPRKYFPAGADTTSDLLFLSLFFIS